MECKKVKYSSMEFAQLDIKRFNKKQDKRKKPISAYKCTICDGFHLTSKPDYKNIIEQLKSEISKLKDELAFEKRREIRFYSQHPEYKKLNIENNKLKLEIKKLKELNLSLTKEKIRLTQNP